MRTWRGKEKEREREGEGTLVCCMEQDPSVTAQGKQVAFKKYPIRFSFLKEQESVKFTAY